MPLSLFKTIIDENPCLLELNICPLGEPLLRGDDFFAMASYSREREIWTRTVTNATLLHSNNNVAKIASCDFNEIVISIDSFNEVVYEKLRRGSKLPRVLRNIQLLHDYFSANSLPNTTKLNMVITPENQDFIANDIETAVSVGFRNISLTIDPFNWDTL